MNPDQDAVLGVVNRVFIGTDARDWAAVRSCFAPSVLFDMTSVAGGEPSWLSKVTLFRFKLEFVDGNLELEKD